MARDPLIRFRRAALATMLVGAGIAALAVAGPVASQESLLPPGFDQPPPATPTPTPAPVPTPAPTSTPTPGNVSGPAPPVTPLPPDKAIPPDESDTGALDEATAPPQLRFDLPPSARRSLDRIGPLTPEYGGMAANAFGASGGNYLAILMRETQVPIASRWASILLRRALMSAVDTPTTINGADWAAARASLLLRMGEAGGARALVQSVDSDDATPRLLNVALGTYMANADPGGLCPLVQFAKGMAETDKWDIARSMCAAMAGEAGVASSTIDRVANRIGRGEIDVLLAQRIVGAGAGGRRSVTIQWDDVDALDTWRLGLATAAGLDIPDRLTQPLNARMEAWRVLAPMTPIDTRVANARAAASIGILSHSAYVDLLGFAQRSQDRSDDTLDMANTLRDAFAAARPADRIAAMKQIWGDNLRGNAYGAYVATARAAAALPVADGYGADADALIASMLTGGYDTTAARWADVLDRGSVGWAMVALADPRGGPVSSGEIDDFRDNDDSGDDLATQFFVAGLAGLGRIDGDTASDWAGDLDVSLSRETRWTRAIDAAAARGEQGTVAVLVGVGMQGRGWENVSPLHLYHVVRALRQVGLDPEARMIAAEAVVRS